MQIIQSGVVNLATPRTRRAFSSFPSLLTLADGSILACYRVGSSKDCDDETIELRRSTDLGLNWSDPFSPFPSFEENGHPHSLKLVYLTKLSNNILIAVAMAVDRGAYPGRPLFNEETLGCLPMRVLISRSSNHGDTWQPWRVVDTPAEIGPPSLTNSLLQLPDGRLAMSLESNKHYFDSSQWLQKVIYLYSDDGGLTWGNSRVVSEDPTGRMLNWDQRAEVAPDGSIVTFSWVFDTIAGEYRNIWRRHSVDGGAAWTEPEELELKDQPGHPAILADGKLVFTWVDHFIRPGIRARMARGFREQFIPETEVSLYEAQSASSNQSGTGETLTAMSSWWFGLPFASVLSNGDVMAVYYAGSAVGTAVYWARLAVGA